MCGQCQPSVSLLTWDGHDGDCQKGGCARDHVEDGETSVSSGSSGEEEAEQVHERHNSPAIQQQQQQHIYEVVVCYKSLDSKSLEYHLRVKNNLM